MKYFTQQWKKPLAAWVWAFACAAGVVSVCSRSSFFYPLNNWGDAQCFFTVGTSMVDVYKRQAKAFGKPLGEGGLARAQPAGEAHQTAGGKAAGQPLAQSHGLGAAGGVEDGHETFAP